MITPEELETEAHENALRRQWTINDGRAHDRHIGSWVNIYDVLDKIDHDIPLARTERRVLAKYERKHGKYVKGNDMEIEWNLTSETMQTLLRRLPTGQLDGIIEDMKDDDEPREQIDLIRAIRESDHIQEGW